jgi:hypothetical protein
LLEDELLLEVELLLELLDEELLDEELPELSTVTTNVSTNMLEK